MGRRQACMGVAREDERDSHLHFYKVFRLPQNINDE